MLIFLFHISSHLTFFNHISSPILWAYGRAYMAFALPCWVSKYGESWESRECVCKLIRFFLSDRTRHELLLEAQEGTMPEVDMEKEQLVFKPIPLPVLSRTQWRFFLGCRLNRSIQRIIFIGFFFWSSGMVSDVSSDVCCSSHVKWKLLGSVFNLNMSRFGGVVDDKNHSLRLFIRRAWFLWTHSKQVNERDISSPQAVNGRKKSDRQNSESKVHPPWSSSPTLLLKQ